MAARETTTDRYTVAAGTASAIGDAAQKYGIDIDPLCKALNIDPATFHDVTARVSLDRLCRLLETCALITKDEAFGLKCMDHFKAGSTGPFGFGLMTAPTALDFMRFLADHMTSVYSNLTMTDQGAEFAWSYAPVVLQANQFCDLTIGLLMARLRSVIGSSIDAIEIGLERPKPDYLGPFRERLPRKLGFDRRINTIRMPAELFSIANPAGDVRLFQLMDLQCRSFRPAPVGERAFVDEFREFLIHRVSENNVSLAEAARYFHVSERTLQRRLLEHGTSLADLRDEVRRDLARKFLVETELSAAEIALRLGYSQASAFTRSTLRWFGVTPRDYRRENKPAA